MRDLTYCGPVPANEDCEQLGPNYRADVARSECIRYRDQLRAQFGPEPEGASLRIKSEPHDFGSYLEVVCSFDDNDSKAVEYAYACESDAWPEWRTTEPPDTLT